MIKDERADPAPTKLYAAAAFGLVGTASLTTLLIVFIRLRRQKRLYSEGAEGKI